MTFRFIDNDDLSRKCTPKSNISVWYKNVYLIKYLLFNLGKFVDKIIMKRYVLHNACMIN